MEKNKIPELKKTNTRYAKNPGEVKPGFSKRQKNGKGKRGKHPLEGDNLSTAS